MVYWADDSARVIHVVVLTIFCFFDLVAVICRLWARKIQKAKYQVNDWLCFAGLVFAVSLSIWTMISNIYWDLGGKPSQYGSPEAILSLVKHEVKAMLVGQILSITAVFLLRASILSLYVHIFRVKPFRMGCYVIHGINFIYFAGTVLAACLICRPISANWDPHAGTCGDEKSFDLYIGTCNMILDVTIVVLPLPIVWKLQMTRAKKIALSVVFGMGLITCVVTLMRIWVITLLRPDNVQQIYSLIALLACLEALLGVVNCCLPVIRPVFTRIGNCKFWSSFMSSLSGNRVRPLSRLSSGTRSGTRNCNRRSREQAGKEMHNWPSSNHNLAPRFVDNKAATMMFPHCNPSTSVISGGGSTRPPPKKSTFHGTDSEWDNGKSSGIRVQQDWDVERGDSQETEVRPLKDDCERMW